MTVAHLEAALAAARAQDHAAAREAVIAAWRVRRAPALAELADLFSARAPDALAHRIAGLATPHAATLMAYLRAAAEVDDPRMAAGLSELLAALPDPLPTEPRLRLALFDAAHASLDPRLHARAAAIRAAITARLGPTEPALARAHARLDALLAACPPLPPPPSAAEQALEADLATAVAPLRRQLALEATLLAEIYARPDDDAPRQVYADVLLERGDPRGELIVLQLARAASADEPTAREPTAREPTAREHELLAAHQGAWLGPLAPILDWRHPPTHTRFRRGFLADAGIVARLDPTWPHGPSGSVVGPAGDPRPGVHAHPAWATVERLPFAGDGMASAIREFAPLTALRELRLASEEAIASLARRTSPLPALTRLQLARVRAPFARLAHALPRLATLACDAGDPTLLLADEALATYAAGGVAHLEILLAPMRDTPAHVARFATAAVGTPATFARVTLVSFRRGRAEVLALRADAAGRYERVP